MKLLGLGDKFPVGNTVGTVKSITRKGVLFELATGNEYFMTLQDVENLF